MGSITVGIAATLKSNTIENILYEALTIASIWENDLVKNPTAEKRIALAVDIAAKRLTASFNQKISREKTASGSTTFPVQSQFVNSGYSAGTGGTIVSSNIYSAIVEICEEIQKRDADQSKNPQGLNTVLSLSYDSETLIVTGSVNLAIDVTTDGTGNNVTRAKVYLLD